MTNQHPGWRAVTLLTEHTGQGCARCDRFVGAVAAGRHPDDVIHLRCEPAQQWQAYLRALTEDTSAAGDPPPHRFEPCTWTGPDGPTTSDWCGYGALGGADTFCGGLAEDPKHENGLAT